MMQRGYNSEVDRTQTTHFSETKESRERALRQTLPVPFDQFAGNQSNPKPFVRDAA